MSQDILENFIVPTPFDNEEDTQDFIGLDLSELNDFTLFQIAAHDEADWTVRTEAIWRLMLMAHDAGGCGDDMLHPLRDENNDGRIFIS